MQFFIGDIVYIKSESKRNNNFTHLPFAE